jgi:hypothetical protein
MCPHTTTYVYLILLYMFCSRTAPGNSRELSRTRLSRDISLQHEQSSYCYICVLILLYMCPHTTMCVSAYYYICVLMLLCICALPQSARSTRLSRTRLSLLYVSSYGYICVLILEWMCPHTTIYVSSYCYVCVLRLERMCPHTAMYASSF